MLSVIIRPLEFLSQLSSGLAVFWSRLSPSGSLPELSVYPANLFTLSEREDLSLGSSSKSPRIEKTFVLFFFINHLLFEGVAVAKASNMMIVQPTSNLASVSGVNPIQTM